VGARAAARLKHPNIQTIYFLGRDPATLLDFVVMEYLPGGTLGSRISKHRPAVAEAISYFSSICGAVDFAHQHGVIHRDLKPANIMFDSYGKLIVTDFDLARVTGEISRTVAGQTMGTILYMSPEQARGDEITPAADIYSLGVILFELMTNRWPFMDNNPMEILKGHLKLPPPIPSSFNPNVPPHIDSAVLRALAKSPAERFQSAWELACAAANQQFSPTGQPITPVPGDSEPVVNQFEKTLYVPSQASVKILNGPQANQQYTIEKGASLGYGRKKNDIHINDDFASRAHARIDRTETGYVMMDLKSTNGTKLNSQPIAPYTPAALKNGDQIEIGDTLLLFELASHLALA